MLTKRKIIKQQTEELAKKEQRIRELEERCEKLSEMTERYQARETLITKTMTEAAASAERIVNDAEAHAEELKSSSIREYDASQKEAEMLVEAAYQNARDIVKEADNDGKRRRDETEASIRSYASILKSYNEVMKENARQAETHARRYAAFYEQLCSAIPELIGSADELNEREVRQAAEAIEAAEQSLDAHDDERLWRVNDIAPDQQGVVETELLIETLADEETEEAAPEPAENLEPNEETLKDDLPQQADEGEDEPIPQDPMESRDGGIEIPFAADDEEEEEQDAGEDLSLEGEPLVHYPATDYDPVD